MSARGKGEGKGRRSWEERGGTNGHKWFLWQPLFAAAVLARCFARRLPGRVEVLLEGVGVRIERSGERALLSLAREGLSQGV